MVSEIPDEQIAEKPRQSLAILQEAWFRFNSKPVVERTEKESKAMMLQVMRVQKDIRAATSEVVSHSGEREEHHLG